MDPEEKIKKLENEVSEIKRRFCDMSLCLHPMYLEWQEEYEYTVSRMILDG